MLGNKRFRPKMFYSVQLDNLVPQDHELRKVLSLVDFSFIRGLVRDKYSWTGQPSVDPEVIIKMLFIGYYYGILSERQLVKRTQTDLAYRWFLGYDLDEKTPTHSVLSKARQRYGLEVFQSIFDQVVEQCITAGLVGGEQAFMDSTLIDANASDSSLIPRLKVLKASEYTEEIMSSEEDKTPDSHKPSSKKLRLNEKKVSKTDPDATVHKKRGGSGSKLKYKGHHLVDERKRVIIAAGATDSVSRSDGQASPLLLRAKFRHKIKFESFCADSEYGTQSLYHFIFSEEIMPYIPPQLPHTKPNPFAKEAFNYEAEQDVYICPAGQKLVRKRYNPSKKQYAYNQANRGQCKKCPLKQECTPKRGSRVVQRLLYQEDVDRGRELAKTYEYKKQMRRRKHIVESLFGEAKEFHGLRRARFRGLDRVTIQVLWTATVLNIKRILENATEFKRASSNLLKVYLHDFINFFNFYIKLSKNFKFSLRDLFFPVKASWAIKSPT